MQPNHSVMNNNRNNNNNNENHDYHDWKAAPRSFETMNIDNFSMGDTGRNQNPHRRVTSGEAMVRPLNIDTSSTASYNDHVYQERSYHCGPKQYDDSETNPSRGSYFHHSRPQIASRSTSAIAKAASSRPRSINIVPDERHSGDSTHQPTNRGLLHNRSIARAASTKPMNLGTTTGDVARSNRNMVATRQERMRERSVVESAATKTAPPPFKSKSLQTIAGTTNDNTYPNAISDQTNHVVRRSFTVQGNLDNGNERTQFINDNTPPLLLPSSRSYPSLPRNNMENDEEAFHRVRGQEMNTFDDVTSHRGPISIDDPYGSQQQRRNTINQHRQSRPLAPPRLAEQQQKPKQQQHRRQGTSQGPWALRDDITSSRGPVSIDDPGLPRTAKANYDGIANNRNRNHRNYNENSNGPTKQSESGGIVHLQNPRPPPAGAGGQPKRKPYYYSGAGAGGARKQPPRLSSAPAIGRNYFSADDIASNRGPVNID